MSKESPLFCVENKPFTNTARNCSPRTPEKLQLHLFSFICIYNLRLNKFLIFAVDSCFRIENAESISSRDNRIPILLKWSELTELELCHPDNANRISHLVPRCLSISGYNVLYMILIKSKIKAQQQ